jgi:RNA polymerase sigma-70 factor (ECF subfamily)
LTAWQKQPSGIGQGDLRRWLFRVTTNRCNLEHRRRSRWRKVIRGLVRVWRSSNREAGATDAACQTEEQELVRRALDGLEPQLRSILVLRYFAEFTSKEIGNILGLPDSTVRSRLCTARQELASELKRTGYTDD